MAEKRIPFMKMNGCGNDFIVVDNRQGIMDGFDLAEFVRNVCARGQSVGADGFMMLENSATADFTMRYFNADGSEGEMCGNGARCIARFATLVGAAGERMRFETLAGMYEAQVDASTRTVKVKFPDVARNALKLNQPYEEAEPAAHYHSGFVGVPHTVWFVGNLPDIPDRQIAEWGRRIRYDARRFPQGTNVNFAEVLNRHALRIRTYERGVEAETLACGSGSTAAAIVSAILGMVDAASPVDVHTRGGLLRISFRLTEDAATEVYLEGNAKLVAKGELLPEAWK